MFNFLNPQLFTHSNSFEAVSPLCPEGKRPPAPNVDVPPHWTQRRRQHLLAQVDWPISTVMATKADILAKRAQRTLRVRSRWATRATADGSLLQSQSFAMCYMWRDRTRFPVLQFIAFI